MSRARNMENVLRHPDGSVDIAAYAKIAHRERAAAIVSLMRETIRVVREMLPVVRARPAPVEKSEPASGKHRAATGR